MGTLDLRALWLHEHPHVAVVAEDDDLTSGLDYVPTIGARSIEDFVAHAEAINIISGAPDDAVRVRLARGKKVIYPSGHSQMLSFGSASR